MANATVLSHGQINGAGADDALFLKVFSGEVLAAFAEANILMPLHMVRTIQFGKSEQFPATWRVSSAYHTPGVELTGQQVNHNERVVTIDDLLVAAVFIPEIDEAKSHYEVRSIYSVEAGRSLGTEMDKHVAQVGCLAARASATITGASGGTQLTNAGYETTGSTLAGGFYDAAQAMDEKDIPSAPRHSLLRPAQYYLLPQTTDVVNKDWGGEGSYARGSVNMVAEIMVNKSNHLPSTNIASGPSAYQGNFTNTVGLIWHPMAMATVKLRDLSIRMDYDPRRLGHLVVAKVAVGHGITRPECAVEFLKA